MTTCVFCNLYTELIHGGCQNELTKRTGDGGCMYCGLKFRESNPLHNPAPCPQCNHGDSAFIGYPGH